MSNDAWDNFADAPAASLDSEPADDGYYRVSVRYIPREGKDTNAMYALVVTEPAASAGHTIITNLNDPNAYPTAAQLLVSKWKSFVLACSNRKGSDFMKCKTFADKSAFFDGATAHVFFRPAVLVKKNNGYSAIDFVTEEKYKASVGNNGKLMRAHATAPTSGGAAASRKEEFGDL